MRRTLCLFLLLLGLALHAAPLLQEGDRMVFCGDSITDQMIYTRLVMDYLALRYPGVHVVFYNTGISGSTAGGWKGGFADHVLALKPTVVSICLGMNDGEYKPFDQQIADGYAANMSDLVRQAKGGGAKVVLLTPGVIDDDTINPTRGKGIYNDTLGKLATTIEGLAAREGAPVFNIHTLMLDVETRAKAATPGFTMIPDGVHPAPPGHVLMAYGLLKALDLLTPAASVTVDTATRTTVPARCTVTDLNVTADKVTFTRTDAALPTYLPPEAVTALGKLTPVLAELNDYRLTVTGLAAGTWALTVEKDAVGTFTADELAHGVNLGLLPGPWTRLAKTVDDRASLASRQYYRVYHGLGARHFPQVADADTPTLQALTGEMETARQAYIAKLVTAYEAGERARAEIPAAARTWQWTLTRVP